MWGLIEYDVHCNIFYVPVYLVLPTDEEPSAQLSSHTYPQGKEPYTNEPPPSYDVLYTATAPDPQAVQVSFCVTLTPYINRNC